MIANMEFSQVIKLYTILMSSQYKPAIPASEDGPKVSKVISWEGQIDIKSGEPKNNRNLWGQTGTTPVFHCLQYQWCRWSEGSAGTPSAHAPRALVSWKKRSSKAGCSLQQSEGEHQQSCKWVATRPSLQRLRPYKMPASALLPYKFYTNFSCDQLWPRHL